jgi:hypothetical protein
MLTLILLENPIDRYHRGDGEVEGGSLLLLLLLTAIELSLGGSTDKASKKTYTLTKQYTKHSSYKYTYYKYKYYNISAHITSTLIREY